MELLDVFQHDPKIFRLLESKRSQLEVNLKLVEDLDEVLGKYESGA